MLSGSWFVSVLLSFMCVIVESWMSGQSWCFTCKEQSHSVFHSDCLFLLQSIKGRATLFWNLPNWISDCKSTFAGWNPTIILSFYHFKQCWITHLYPVFQGPFKCLQYVLHWNLWLKSVILRIIAHVLFLSLDYYIQYLRPLLENQYQ